jgi:hypothetical protein
MRRSSTLRSALVALVAVLALGAVAAASASAESATRLCVPEETGKPVTSGGTEGKCEAKNTAVELPPTAELTTLNKILPHIAYVAEGIDKKPTIQFSGVNVQIIDGEGKTASVNGEGNLVIGYDETPGEQTGSHNLILGEKQTFTSYGGILAGFENTMSKPFASVTGGAGNHATGEASSVTGGEGGIASGEFSSVTAGAGSTASGKNSSVTAGEGNTASGLNSSVAGGYANKASETDASVTGGESNTAKGTDSSVSGGDANTAKGTNSSVLGGWGNVAEANFSTVYGSKKLTATKEYEAVG